MKKGLSLLLLICLVISLSAGCGKSSVFEENDGIFFRMLLNRLDRDQVDIHSLDAYKLDNRYYYHVTYSYVSPVTDEWTDADLVYFGSYQIDRYFSLTWDDFGGLENDLTAYNEAVSSGEHKTFSQEEIQQHIDAFYTTQ